MTLVLVLCGGVWVWALAHFIGEAMRQGTTVGHLFCEVLSEWLRGLRVVFAALGFARHTAAARRIRELERELGFDLEAGRDC